MNLSSKFSENKKFFYVPKIRRSLNKMGDQEISKKTSLVFNNENNNNIKKMIKIIKTIMTTIMIIIIKKIKKLTF